MELAELAGGFVTLSAYKTDACCAVDEDAVDLDDGHGEPLGDTEPETEPVHRRNAIPIEELLRKGQEVLVQVSKESLGTKGARITSFVSIPGRYIVYMPQSGHVGVSRRIRNDAERDRLRGIVKGLPPPPGGFIVRTVAEGKAAEELTADIEFLTRLWSQVQSRFESAPAPSLLHAEMDLTFRVVRDLFSPDIEEFLVDTPAAYEKCLHFAESLVPQLASRVKLYEAPQPVFESTGIEKEIDKALRRRVWLKSGGYIVINQTEALVAIDINTGKYVGKSNRLEDTIVKTNVDAIKDYIALARTAGLQTVSGSDAGETGTYDHDIEVLHGHGSDAIAAAGRLCHEVCEGEWYFFRRN